MEKEKVSQRVEKLSKDFGSHMNSFFERNFLEQMEQVQKMLFRTKPQNPLGKALKEISDELARNCGAMPEQEKLEHLEEFQTRLFVETRRFLSRHIDELLYICLLRGLFCPTGGPNFGILSPDYIENIREQFNLKTSGELQKQFLEIFKNFFPEPITHGGSEGFWSEWDRLLFLASYNRYQIVIRNARNDKNILKKHGKRKKDIKEELAEKYLIPEDYVGNIFDSDSTATIALKWAARISNIKVVGIESEDDENEEIETDEDSSKRKPRTFRTVYLTKVILGKARKDAEKRVRGCQLVGANFINGGITRVYTIVEGGTQALKFPLPVPPSYDPKRDTYLVFNRKG